MFDVGSLSENLGGAIGYESLWGMSSGTFSEENTDEIE
jgi:hypothetical protein